MARYEITGPDGAKYEVTALDTAGEDAVLTFFRAQTANAAPPSHPPLSTGELAADVAKSTGIGLVQGGLGVATLPGNLEALGRMGINAGGRALGADQLVSEDALLPTYSDAKSAVEGVTGEFYKPKSTAGEYARTFGEFAPAAFGGVGLASRVARVAAPATLSETAGQLTKGTDLEPWARIGGGLAGGRMPVPGAAPRAARNAQYNAHVQNLTNEGVTALTAAQRTGNRPMRIVEDASGVVPGAGTRGRELSEQAAEQFTQAALRRAGVNAPRATTDVMDQAFTTAGQQFQQFFAPLTVVPTNQTRARITQILRDYEANTPQSAQIPLVRGIAGDIHNQQVLAGPQYAAWRSDLRAAQRTHRDNPKAQRTIGHMIDELDEALARSAPPGQQQQIRQQLNQMNEQYRHLLAIETATKAAGENARLGLVSPMALRQAVKTQAGREYSRGRNDLGRLADSGEAVMRPLNSSGTAERTQALSNLDLLGGIGGAALVGDVTGALAGFARPAAKALAARAVMSRPGQAAIQNERVMPTLGQAAQGDRATLSTRIAPLAMEGERGLTGGSGPSFDAIERQIKDREGRLNSATNEAEKAAIAREIEQLRSVIRSMGAR